MISTALLRTSAVAAFAIFATQAQSNPTPRPANLVAPVTSPSLTAAPTPRPGKSSAIVVAQSSGFSNWVRGFRARARAKGIRSDVFDRAFQGVSVNQQVIKLDRRQAEFTKTIWQYLDTAVSDKRIKNGRSMRKEWQKTLNGIEKRYGVDQRVVLSIWGMETAYGSFMGGLDVIEALATLAYEGRRRSWAEGQLIAALSIIQSGDVSPAQMSGSWAGAMGHTQFIPTSYIAYAQDYYGDGKRDVWNPRNPTDALASTANYLRKSGWVKGAPWGIEVTLPSGFNYNATGTSKKSRRPVSQWNAKGVRTIDGKRLPDYGSAAIYLPAGARGPAFAVYKNFYVIKRYNNANSYAMGVGHLGDRIYGGRDFVKAWPRGERKLLKAERRDLQRRLTARGFDTGGADGIIGPNSERAIKAFQRSVGMVPDGYPSSAVLDRLK